LAALLKGWQYDALMEKVPRVLSAFDLTLRITIESTARGVSDNRLVGHGAFMTVKRVPQIIYTPQAKAMASLTEVDKTLGEDGLKKMKEALFKSKISTLLLLLLLFFLYT